MAPEADGPESLGALRRGGAITELLFVYECATLEPNQLRPIAERLGLTVQATSYCYRQLARRGLVELRGGRYRPTVRGVAWLHETLGRLRTDVERLLERLHVVRSTRAIAGEALRAGEVVSLDMVEGLLTAHRGVAGPSRGRVTRDGARGSVVGVTDLEGIVPLAPATIVVRTVRPNEVGTSQASAKLRGLLAAQGLEAVQFVRSTYRGPLARFAVAETVREASRLGVGSTVVVLEDELPRLMAGLSGGPAPPLEVLPLLPGRPITGRARRRSRGAPVG
jgi:predicted transcriptional regulator